MAQMRPRFWVLIVITCYLHLSSGLRSFRETCGTQLHARHRETVPDGRRCDRGKGLVCSHNRCQCGTFQEYKEKEASPQVAWNLTHCVVKLQEVCRIYKSYASEFPFLPNLTQTEELFCGRGAMCTDSGCVCPEGMGPDRSHLNCVEIEDDDSGSGHHSFCGVLRTLILSACFVYFSRKEFESAA